jgi:hypothetical protein
VVGARVWEGDTQSLFVVGRSGYRDVEMSRCRDDTCAVVMWGLGRCASSGGCRWDDRAG